MEPTDTKSGVPDAKIRLFVYDYFYKKKEMTTFTPQSIKTI